jgi:hypothetical protein
MLSGALFAQPVFFAIWMVLGSGASVKRLPLTLALFVLVLLAGVFNVWSLLEQGALRQPSFVIPGLALFGLAAGAASIVRWRTGWQILLSPGVTSKGSTTQFSLKYLLGWMTICAMLIAVLHRLAFKDSNLPDGHRLILLAISLALIFLIVLPAACVALVVLSSRPRGRILLASSLLWGTLIWLTIEAMLLHAATLGIKPDDRSEITSFVIWAQAGAVAAALTCAFLLRVAGFRLHSWRSIMTMADNCVRSQGAPNMPATKPLYDKKEFARRGEAIYKRDIEPQLTDAREDDFVAIDIESGHYEIDADEVTAADRLLARIPNAQTWVRRVGSPYVRRFGSARTGRS